MNANRKQEEDYNGFEQGPIRPPSEAASLLIRITRNCPWNRCTFCPVYKGSDFSLRPVAHVLEDIDRVYHYVEAIKECGAKSGKIYSEDLIKFAQNDDFEDRGALNAALQWASNGMRSIFLQDANSLIIKPEHLITILQHLGDCFPWVERITSYARSHTIARISDDNLRVMANAGLSRIHIGMESGADSVLGRVKKGVDKKTHIKAGIKVKKAGMALSEYLMPGLGGRDLSEEHARESADALNQIDPDFIRLRTLALPEHIELFKEYSAGTFQKLSDVETARELLLFLESLDGINSVVKSDHILNLFEDLEGKYPEDKEKMIGIVQGFLDLPPEDQVVYQVGRRIGVYRGLGDMKDVAKTEHVEATCKRLGIQPDNVNEAVDELMKRFI